MAFRRFGSRGPPRRHGNTEKAFYANPSVSELALDVAEGVPPRWVFGRTRIQYRLMRIPLWLKTVWTACVMAWIPLYWRQYGSQNFLYFCDLGNLFIVAALWLESSLLFSWQACSLLLFQSLFTVDLASVLLSGRHLIGGTEFMFAADIPLGIRLLSLFHVVTPLLLLWAIWRLGYDRRGWKYQTLTAWIVVPINYFWRPEYDVNWARGPFSHEQHAIPGLLYLLGYLIVVPAVVYLPTHRFLLWLTRKDTAISL